LRRLAVVAARYLLRLQRSNRVELVYIEKREANSVAIHDVRTYVNSYFKFIGLYAVDSRRNDTNYVRAGGKYIELADRSHLGIEIEI
jgi:hypothetical protein